MQRFSNLIAKRKKSLNINKLIKKEIDKIERKNEEKELNSGFQEASFDKERLEALSEWDILDTEGWE